MNDSLRKFNNFHLRMWLTPRAGNRITLSNPSLIQLIDQLVW